MKCYLRWQDQRKHYAWLSIKSKIGWVVVGWRTSNEMDKRTREKADRHTSKFGFAMTGI